MRCVKISGDGKVQIPMVIHPNKQPFFERLLILP